ncbi:MAG: MurR/RpiR family transcriptional regulator [Pygmaiobacter sp.]|nr:MurR/RpiR family transcriptional regulator [Pygmaiobacter sp.]
MNIFDQMELCKADFTPREREIYEIFRSEPDVISQNTTVAIAARYGIAQSAISRFCQKIGFNSFSDFRMSLALSLAAHSFRDSAAPPDEKSDWQMTDYICDLVRSTGHMVGDETLRRLSSKVIEADHIYVTGTARSSIPAQLLVSLLVQLCQPSYFIEPGLEVETLHIMKNSDLVILFSSQNPTHKEFLDMAVGLSQAHRPSTLLVTHSPKHPVSKMVDDVVVLPTWASLHYPISIESSTSCNVFCSLLSSQLTKDIAASTEQQ